MNNQDYVWINVDGGVMGFTPKTIIDFETDYKQNAEPFGFGYWEYFTMVFSRELNEKTAYCFSSLWTQPQTLKKLNQLRAESIY